VINTLSIEAISILVVEVTGAEDLSSMLIVPHEFLQVTLPSRFSATAAIPGIRFSRTAWQKLHPLDRPWSRQLGERWLREQLPQAQGDVLTP